MYSLPRMLIAAAGAVVVMGMAGQAFASPIRFSLKLSGPLDATAVLLWNKSSIAEITDLSMTIGDTTFNFDRAGLESIPTDTGTALTYALDSPDAANGIVRDDTLTYSFGGFDPGDQFGFRFEIDPDSFDAIVDYRTVLFNNGAAPNSVISVSFMEGIDTETLDVTMTDYDDPTYKANVFSGRGHIGQVPEPASMALFGLGLVGLGLMTRRRSRR